MTDLLTEPLKAVLADIVATAPTPSDHPIRSVDGQVPDPPRRARTLVASALAAAAAIAGLVVLTNREQPSTPPAATPPSATPGTSQTTPTVPTASVVPTTPQSEAVPVPLELQCGDGIYTLGAGDNPDRVATIFDVPRDELDAHNTGTPGYAEFEAGTMIVIPGTSTDCPVDGGSPAIGTTTTISVTSAQVEPYGPLDYAPTDRALPHWPAVNATDSAATTTGYGMNLCDGGYGTKVMRVDPATGPSHAYSGTLCVFIELTEARLDAITTCATTTELFNYARCQRRTDATDVTDSTPGPVPEPLSAVATADQQAAMAAFPAATAWDQAEQFSGRVSAATESAGSVAFEDDTVKVTLTPAATDPVDPPGVCFVIELSGAVADGCVGRGPLATGLAYGAFQDGNGPIEIVGIVPDDVVAVEIDGTKVTPTNNVWHHTARGSAIALPILIRSVDGTSATAVGQTYVIQPGDLPSTVAGRFGISVYDLISVNGLTLDGQWVTDWPGVGAELVIPMG